jgi:hypothetical protein
MKVHNPTDPNHIFRRKVKDLRDKILKLPMTDRETSRDMYDLRILISNKPKSFSLEELRELIDKLL